MQMMCVGLSVSVWFLARKGDGTSSELSHSGFNTGPMIPPRLEMHCLRVRLQLYLLFKLHDKAWKIQHSKPHNYFFFVRVTWCAMGNTTVGPWQCVFSARSPTFEHNLMALNLSTRRRKNTCDVNRQWRDSAKRGKLLHKQTQASHTLFFGNSIVTLRLVRRNWARLSCFLSFFLSFLSLLWVFFPLVRESRSLLLRLLERRREKTLFLSNHSLATTCLWYAKPWLIPRQSSQSHCHCLFFFRENFLNTFGCCVLPMNRVHLENIEHAHNTTTATTITIIIIKNNNNNNNNNNNSKCTMLCPGTTVLRQSVAIKITDIDMLHPGEKRYFPNANFDEWRSLTGRHEQRPWRQWDSEGVMGASGRPGIYREISQLWQQGLSRASGLTERHQTKCCSRVRVGRNHPHHPAHTQTHTHSFYATAIPQEDDSLRLNPLSIAQVYFCC